MLQTTRPDVPMNGWMSSTPKDVIAPGMDVLCAHQARHGLGRGMKVRYGWMYIWMDEL